MEDQGNLTLRFEKLVAENHALHEDLKLCKIDKDFVWNLWKRLQSAKPDLASVISMVVAREKEKNEKKDLKILEILEMKDEKIKEMRESLDEAVNEMRQNKERFHDLLIENDELKQKLDEKESETSHKAKEMEDKNQYLSQLVKAYQEEKVKGDKELTDNLDKIEGERNVLKSQIKNLECQVDKLTEDKTSLASAMETNATLQEKIENLRKELEEFSSKSEQVENEHQDAISAIRLREAQLQEERKSSQFLSSEVRDKDKELIKLRAELAERSNGHDKAMGHIREQTAVIEHMQNMQDKLHQVLADRKQAYEREVISLQKAVAEMQVRCSEYQERDSQLQQRLEVLRENDERHLKEMTSKDELLEHLKEALTNAGRESPAKRARREDESCMRCRELLERLETVETEREELADALNEKTRRISSLERTLKSTLMTKQRTDEPMSSAGSPERVTTDEQTSVLYQEEAAKLKDKLDRSEKKVEDIKTLLDLKDSELTEVRRAHAQRQQRYRLLKDNYNLVLNQLRTFENEPKERSPAERPSDRALRHHNSDGVWNELAYYKGEYEKLEKERHDVLEELDVLRVHHANDLTTIQELRLCLGEERDGLLHRLTKEEENMESKLTRETQRFEKQEEEMAVWRDKAVRSNKKITELEEEIGLVQHEKESLRGENENLKRDNLNLERQLESAVREVEERLHECELLRKDLELNRDLGARSMADDPLVHIGEENPQFIAGKRGRKDSPGKMRIEQQAKDINMYDEQLKKIAEKILSPSKHSPPRPRTSHGTQTLGLTRTADFSATVDLDADSEEEAGDGEVAEVDRSVTGGRGRVLDKRETPRKAAGQQTPRGKKGVIARRTPARNEWTSMKQRILSLTQQVAALRTTKDKAVKTLADEKSLNENLRSELSIVLQRFQVTKNTAQTLSEDMKKCLKEKEALITEKETLLLQNNEEELRRLEEKLKTSSSECSRLAYVVKSERNENKDLRDKVKDLQERGTRMERDVSQKKALIEEMKNKLRRAHSQEAAEADAVKDLEEKIRRLAEREVQKKIQVDSLKRQLDAETREKEKFQQQYYVTQEEVKKKARLLSESRVLRGQAEMAVNEMEAAATHQLHGLANQSQAAISSIQNKLDKANERVEEFQAFVKTLVDELLTDMVKTTKEILRLEDETKREELSKPSSLQARDLACSILNMTSNDLEDFMKEDGIKDNERQARKKKEKDWKDKLDVSLKKEIPFAVSLLEIVLDILEERLLLVWRHREASQNLHRSR